MNAENMENKDTEISLVSGAMRVTVSPLGAALRGLWREERGGERTEIVTGYSGIKNKVGGQGDVLIPFPGRIRSGRYVFAGEAFQMEISDKEGPNAIHGFLRLLQWEIVAQSAEAVTFAVSLDAEANPGYPFSLRATVTYTVLPDGMTCGFTIENIGDRPAPVAAGFHPYFTVGSDQINRDTLKVPFGATLEFEDMLPTGNVLPVEGTPLDFRTALPIGDTKFNTCFVQPQRDSDGIVRIRLAAPDNAQELTVWMDKAFDYVVLYSGDPLPEAHRRRSLAIEPMTCASDGFNHPEWGLVTLAPGASFSGEWGVSTP